MKTREQVCRVRLECVCVACTHVFVYLQSGKIRAGQTFSSLSVRRTQRRTQLKEKGSSHLLLIGCSTKSELFKMHAGITAPSSMQRNSLHTDALELNIHHTPSTSLMMVMAHCPPKSCMALTSAPPRRYIKGCQPCCPAGPGRALWLGHQKTGSHPAWLAGASHAHKHSPQLLL